MKALAALWFAIALFGLSYVGTPQPVAADQIAPSNKPRSGTGDSLNLFFATSQSLPLCSGLFTLLSSFVTDHVARIKLGGVNLNYFYLEQLPVLPPSVFASPCDWTGSQSVGDWIRPRGVELVYTAVDMEPFARDMGYTGPPFVWDDERHSLIRCELDAAFFHLYGIGRDDVVDIMERFPIVKRKDEQRHSEYRTARVILEYFDKMGKVPYRSTLVPEPGAAL